MLAAGSDAISVTDRTKWYQQVGPPSELYFQINWKVSYGDCETITAGHVLICLFYIFLYVLTGSYCDLHLHGLEIADDKTN